MGKRKPKLKTGTRQYGKPKSAVTVPPCPWDMGAMGQANRAGLTKERATEITPDGEVPNPNGIERMRRRSSAEDGLLIGALQKEHVIAAHELRSLAEGGHMTGSDPLSAIVIDVSGNGVSDPQAAAFDARRKFHAAWSRVPHEFRPELERFVIENQTQEQAFGRKMCDIINGYAKIRAGLRAAFGETE